MTCDLCNGTGYRMVDVGTATIPDYIEARCACNPAPTDADYDSHVPGTAWEDFHPDRPVYLYGTE